MTTLEIIQYYANLLIIQYNGKPRAIATIESTVNPVVMPDYNIQSIEFSEPPVSGTFQLTYGSVETGSINWDASAAAVQSALTIILTAPLSVVVTGTIEDGLTATFSNATDAVEQLRVTSNNLLSADFSLIVGASYPLGTELPLEVQGGFNITGANTAVGVQLDILAKYVGVTRSGNGFNGPVSLGDADFYKLIQMGILKNRSDSSLRSIQLLLNQFFSGEVLVFDYANMHMSYLIDSNIGSQDLVDLFVTEGLLPRPMGVGLSVIVYPVIDSFFVLVTYDAYVGILGTPFNTYDDYNTDWFWVSYADSVPI